MQCLPTVFMEGRPQTIITCWWIEPATPETALRNTSSGLLPPLRKMSEIDNRLLHQYCSALVGIGCITCGREPWQAHSDRIRHRSCACERWINPLWGAVSSLTVTFIYERECNSEIDINIPKLLVAVDHVYENKTQLYFQTLLYVVRLCWHCQHIGLNRLIHLYFYTLLIYWL